MTPGEWKKNFKSLGEKHRHSMFDIGDQVNECVRQHGEKAYQLIESIGLATDTVLQAARVAERWPLGSRFNSLGYAYHRDAGLDMDVARPLLECAVRNGWSRDTFRAARKELIRKLNEKDKGRS